MGVESHTLKRPQQHSQTSYDAQMVSESNKRFYKIGLKKPTYEHWYMYMAFIFPKPTNDIADGESSKS